MRTGPVSIDRFPEGSSLDGLPGLHRGKAERQRQGDEIVKFTDVHAIYEVSLEDGPVILFALALSFRPFGEFLGEPRVEDPAEVSEGKIQVAGDLFETEGDGVPIGRPAAGKEVLEGNALFRNLGVKGKSPPGDPDIVLFLQTVYTDRAEITPGSYVIGKNFKKRCFHWVTPEFRSHERKISTPARPLSCLKRR